jgi:hypothetical protein
LGTNPNIVPLEYRSSGPVDRTSVLLRTVNVIAAVGALVGVLLAITTIIELIAPRRATAGMGGGFPSTFGMLLLAATVLAIPLHAIAAVATAFRFGVRPDPTNANNRSVRRTMKLTGFMFAGVAITIVSMVIGHYALISSQNQMALRDSQDTISSALAQALPSGRFPEGTYISERHTLYYGQNVPLQDVSPTNLDAIIVCVSLGTAPSRSRAVGFASGRTGLFGPSEFGRLIDADDNARRSVKAPSIRYRLRISGFHP